MKVFVAILVTVLISVQAEADLKLHGRNFKDLSIKKKFLYTNKLHKHLENFRKILKNGNETLGIPVYDPYEVEHAEHTFNFFDRTFKGFGSLDNLSFTGLSGYDIEKAKFSLLSRSMSLTLKWPLLQGKAFYIFNAFIQSQHIELFGAGYMEQNIEDFKFETIVYFGLKDGNVNIKKMDTEIFFGNYKFTITGFYHDKDISDTISIFITTLVTQIVQDYKKDLVQVVNSLIMIIVNKYLNNLSLLDLLELLG